MKRIWKIFGKSSKKSGTSTQSAARDIDRFPWNPLNEKAQLQEISTLSHKRPQLIFKHSTRCGISAVMLRRMEGNWKIAKETTDFYLLDILSYREVSRAVETAWDLHHQSPQVLLIEDGKLQKATSHSGIAQFVPDQI